MRLKVLYDTNSSIVELHPLALALDDGVVVAKLEALALMDDQALQVVDHRLVACFQPELLWERNPVVQFLLLKCLVVNLESLEVHEE